MAQNAFGHLIPSAQPQAQPAMPQQSQDPIIRPRDPFKDRDQAIQEEANRRANDAAARAAEAANRQATIAERTATIGAIPSGFRMTPQNTLERIPGGPGSGGKPLSNSEMQRSEVEVGVYSGLSKALRTFQDDYAGNTLTGDLENTVQGLYAGFGTPGQREWWAQIYAIDNAVRNELYGATLTPSEREAYERTTVGPSLDPKINRENLKSRVDIIETALDRRRRLLVANGSDPDAVDILFEPVIANRAVKGEGKDKQEPAPMAGGGTAPANPPQSNDPLSTGRVPGGGAGPTTQLQTGETKSVAIAGVQDRYRTMLGEGASGDELAEYLQSVGITNPNTIIQAKKQARYRDQFPNVPLADYPVNFTQDLPLSFTDQAIDYGTQSAPSAFLINAADALSAGTLDNIAGMTGGNAERTRAAMAAVSKESPWAAPAGQIAGGVLGAMTGEAGLARLGMASGIGRGVLADAAYGAASGAGNADTGNRGQNALLGALTAGGGSLAGQGLVRGATRALTPTGQGMNDLYAAGVKPTIGQRGAAMADQGGMKGAVGRMASSAEQKLQSLPVVGSAIRGAREEARDQFQIGAFNEALKEVGEQLPKGVKPGTVPNAYAQKTFDRVYAEARSGMRVVPDEELTTDISKLSADIDVLGPEATAKLQKIIENNVTNRLQNGELTGDLYKKTVSDLEKKAVMFGKGQSAEDQALSSVITDIKFALDAAARRHSDPDAVALLDAADRGYAKLVRIEGAAARAGGPAGTFSPSQFEREVQKQSGGVRSRAFSRGDALMQDFAEQGKSLVDTVPNSGTADRVMAGLAVTGGAVLSPKVAALFGGLLAAYAPGTRKVMQAAISPAGPKRQAIAKQLEKRARLVGSTTAASAGALSQAGSPDQ